MNDINSLQEKPIECPWCHLPPVIIKSPLLHSNREGYRGNFIYIECRNSECKINPRTISYNTDRNGTVKNCIELCIKDWNNR